MGLEGQQLCQPWTLFFVHVLNSCLVPSQFYKRSSPSSGRKTHIHAAWCCQSHSLLQSWNRHIQQRPFSSQKEKNGHVNFIKQQNISITKASLSMNIFENAICLLCHFLKIMISFLQRGLSCWYRTHFTLDNDTFFTSFSFGFCSGVHMICT